MDETLMKAAVSPLLEWYRVCKRDLPWRKARSFYTALVSELMLQQTRVEAVKERYVLFLRRFPTPDALAAASEEEVLKMWEGLGYYSRARNLHKAAKILAAEGLPQPAVDGNVLRILSRLYADGANIDEPATRARFSELLRAAYPPETGDFCEALMELGAIVCVPNGAPLCGECPWQALCRAHLAGEEENYPVRSEKKARRVVDATVLVLQCGNKFALEKRPAKGLLAGLWQFPFFEGDAPDLGEVVAEKRAKHIFTHVEWRMRGKLVRTDAELPRYVWATADEIARTYAVPSAFRAFMEWVR